MKQKKPLAKKSFKLSYRWTTWWQYSFSVSSKQYMYIFRLFFCFVCFCVWRTYIIYWQQLFKSKAPCITRIETVVSLFTTMDMVWLFSSTLPYYCHCSRNTRGWYIYIYICWNVWCNKSSAPAVSICVCGVDNRSWMSHRGNIRVGDYIYIAANPKTTPQIRIEWAQRHATHHDQRLLSSHYITFTFSWENILNYCLITTTIRVYTI